MTFIVSSRFKQYLEAVDSGVFEKIEGKVNNEQLAAEYIRQSGKTVHSSDCATSVAPAEEPKPCDCNEPQPE